MDSFPHVAKPVSVLLHESNDTANFAILEAVVIADAYEGGPTVQVNDQFASSRRNVNVRRKMVVQIDHDLVPVNAKNSRHRDTRS
jgi:hypothetical protein